MVKKIYRKLTKNQKARGVIFSSTLSNSTQEMQGDTVHEVFRGQPDAQLRIKRLKDSGFFAGYKRYNIIRS